MLREASTDAGSFTLKVLLCSLCDLLRDASIWDSTFIIIITVIIVVVFVVVVVSE